MQSLHRPISCTPGLNPLLHLTTDYVKVKVKVKVTLRLTVGQSVSLGVEPHLGPITRYLLPFDSYGLVSVGRPLWWEDRSVFLESKSLGTRDHILHSQIWDFPFRRFLRLAGSRWRYSTPSPLQCIHFPYKPSVRTTQKTVSIVECVYTRRCLSRRCLAIHVTVWMCM
jgi:hypothetical protein